MSDDVKLSPEDKAKQEYLEHLNEGRWVMVKHVNGAGLEVSKSDFLVLPRACKVITEEKPTYRDVLRYKVTDLHNPLNFEIDEASVDYVFITGDFPVKTLDNYTRKVKDGGTFITHLKENGKWTFTIYKVKGGQRTKWAPKKRPHKNVGIMRLGAIGDLMQVTSPVAELKKQGYHVTVYAQNPAGEVLKNNPNIDELVLTDREIVRNSELSPYWNWLKTQHKKFINLCASVEDVWLPNKDRPPFYWPANVREKYLNANYVKFQHELCEVPYEKLRVEFYPTTEEIAWADEERKKMAGKRLICYALNGSSVHKVWPYMDALIAKTMLETKDVDYVLLGDERAQILEGGWQNEGRVHRRAGQWTIRQSITFIQRHADILIGPETGLLNAAATLPLRKIIFLSHSTIQNLTVDWKNTLSLKAPKDQLKCDNCCMHRLHMFDDGFKYIARDETTGVAHCQSLITAEKVFEAIKAELAYIDTKKK